MGRSRLTLKRIASETGRKSTFRQRRDVLLSKMQELSNLCKAEVGEAVEACLIIYDMNVGDRVTWPENLKAEHSLIQRFESQRNEEPPITFGIEEYFNNKKDKVEADILKVRKEIHKIKYPTSHPCFNKLGDEQIRSFIAMLDAKGRACGERMNMLRLQQQVKSSQVNFMQNNIQTQVFPTHMESFDDRNNIASSVLSHDVDSQSPMLHFDPNPMHLMTTNNETTNSADQNGLPLDCATEVGSPNHVGVPPDLTTQSDLDEVDWDSVIEGLIDYDYQNVQQGAQSFFHDEVDWVSSTDWLIDCDYQNVQGAASHTLTPLVDEFQIHEYHNML